MEATNSSDGTLVVSSEIAFEFLARKLQQMVVAITNFFDGLPGETIGYPSTIPHMVAYHFQKAQRCPRDLFRQHQLPLMVGNLFDYLLLRLIGRNKEFLNRHRASSFVSFFKQCT